MDISHTTSAINHATASVSGGAASQLGADLHSFLTLLIAQVSNQDPLEPMDSTAFVSQLAQLTQVEQSVVTNSNLERIDSRLRYVESLSDVQLIGREVTVPTDRIELRDGVASATYYLSNEAESVTVSIRAADGTVLYELTGQPGSPRTAHAVTWDGLDSEGLPVPDGVFEVVVEAVDAQGRAVAYETTAITRVEELSFRGGQALLILRNGGDAYPGSVTSVR